MIEHAILGLILSKYFSIELSLHSTIIKLLFKPLNSSSRIDIHQPCKVGLNASLQVFHLQDMASQIEITKLSKCHLFEEVIHLWADTLQVQTVIDFCDIWHFELEESDDFHNEFHMYVLHWIAIKADVISTGISYSQVQKMLHIHCHRIGDVVFFLVQD